MKILVLAVVSSVASSTLAQAQTSTCGPRTVVQAGDTLSSIARRCDVTEGAILSGNRHVDGSGDLVVGDTVALPSGDEGTGTLSRLGNLAGQATEDLAETTREAGSAIGRSVEGFLSDNPGIKRNLRELTGTASGDAEVRVVAAPTGAAGGRTLRLEASGLPANEEVVITAGPRGEAQTRIASATTDQNGRLSLELPSSAITDADDLRLSVRSQTGAWKASATAAP